MKNQVGNKIIGFPFDNLEKVCDLVYFEGPLLSHYKSGNDNLLFYWVDVDSEHNRWLVIKVEEEQLVKYLRKKISLRDIVLDNIKSFMFVVDINSELIFENTYLIKSFNGIEEYLPEEFSEFKLAIPSLYDNLIAKFKASNYVEVLRESALYFKLTPEDIKYSTTVNIDDVIRFLGSIKNSYLSYIDAKFRNDFATIYLQPERLNKVIEAIKKQLFPRIVDLNWASFGAGVSSDYIMGDTSPEITKWKKTVFTEFKNDVFNIDYSSTEAVNIINNKFSEQQREEIFKPILSALEKKNFNVDLTNSNLEVIKKLKPISEQTYNRLIIPKIAKPVVDDSEKRLINFVVEIPVHGDIKSIKSKDLQQGLQFAEEVTNFPHKTSIIENSTHRITLKSEIECEVNFNEGIYTIKYNPLNIEATGDTNATYIRLFNSTFISEYLRIFDNIKPSKEDASKRKLFEELVLKFEIITQ